MISAVLFSLGIPLLFFYLTLFNSKSCDQLVIDTYEVFSDVLIPPNVEFVNCYYDEVAEIRISVYDLDDTIDLSKFKLSTLSSIVEELKGFDLLTKLERPKKQNLYLLSGAKWGKEWTCVIDIESQRLWTELRH